MTVAAARPASNINTRRQINCADCWYSCWLAGNIIAALRVAGCSVVVRPAVSNENGAKTETGFRSAPS